MKKALITVFALLFVLAFLLGQEQAVSSFSDNPSLQMQPEEKLLPAFSFDIQQDGKFENSNLLGKWTLFFIGYTFCPDICPTTLADLDRIYPELTKAPYNNIQIVFVSVDPNRDKALHLAEYVNYFNPDFKAVTSTHEQLFPFAQDLGLVYSIVDEGETDQYYLIDHSASLVLINPKGEHHASFKAVLNENNIPNVDMDLMVKDIHQLYQNWL